MRQPRECCLMSSDSVFNISSDTKVHGSGHTLTPMAPRYLSVQTVQEDHHNAPHAGSQDRLLLYLSMDHDGAEDYNPVYRSSDYNVCESLPCCHKSKDNTNISAAPPSWATYWKVRQTLKLSGGRGAAWSQASRCGYRAHYLASLSPSLKRRPPKSSKENAC